MFMNGISWSACISYIFLKWLYVPYANIKNGIDGRYDEQTAAYERFINVSQNTMSGK